MKKIKARFSGLVLCLLLLGTLIFAPRVQAVTPTNLLSTNLYTWFQSNTWFSGNFSTSFAGAYVMKAIGNTLYLGLSASVPDNNQSGPILASLTGSTLAKITNLDSEDVSRITVSGTKLIVPVLDPAGSATEDHDAGSMYIYDTSNSTTTKLRYRYPSLHYVDATTTDGTGHYSFSGLKNTAYVVKVIQPANFKFTTQWLNTNNDISLDSDFDTTTGQSGMCKVKTSDTFDYTAGLRLLSTYTDNTIDAGLFAFATAPAGTTTSGTRDDSFYTGGLTIGDRVWNDANKDGLQTGGETGIAGVRVELYTQDPYFPCGIHDGGVYVDSDGTIYMNVGHLAPWTTQGISTNGFANYITKSSDGGTTWQIVSDSTVPDDNSDQQRYWSSDLIKFNNYFYQTARTNGILSFDPVRSVFMQTYPTVLTINNPTFTSRSEVSPNGPTYTVFSSFFGLNAEITGGALDAKNNFQPFHNSLYMLKANQNNFYRFSQNNNFTEITPVGATFGGILSGYTVGASFFGTPLTDIQIGHTNRYNTLTSVNDQYLYGIGINKKVYVSSNGINWTTVTDFSSVDSGAEPGAIYYWPSQNKVVVATVGNTGSLYALDQASVASSLFTKLIVPSYLTAQDATDPQVDLTNIGEANGSVVPVQILKGGTLISMISTTFSGGTLDWSLISADTDTTAGKAVIKNAEIAPGAASTHDLYVPIPNGANTSQLAICPSASDLSQVTTDCPGRVNLDDGQTQKVGNLSVSVTRTQINGQMYWWARGLAGGGGFAVLNGTVQVPTCAALPPAGAPELFQIKTTRSSATLAFSPVLDATHYAIYYGLGDQSEMYASDLPTQSIGVLQITINSLKPSTQYSFKVQPLRDCAPGIFSNTLTATTTSTSLFRTFYLFPGITSQTLISSGNTSTFTDSTSDQTDSGVVTGLATPSPNPVVTQSQQPQPSPASASDSSNQAQQPSIWKRILLFFGIK